MKIAFDITALAEPKTGIGQYRYNLLKNLCDLGDNTKITAYGFNFRSFAELEKIESEFEQFKNSNLKFKISKLPRKPLILSWIFGRVPKLDLFVKDVDLFHVSDNVQSPTNKPTVATIHDLSAVIFPQFHSKRNAFVDHWRFKQISKYCDQVICVSENTMKDFCMHYDFPRDRIRVVYNGVDHDKFFPLSKIELKNQESRLQITDPYILFLGTLEPRKNLWRLIQAFYLLKKQDKIHEKLVICGKKGWMYEEIFKFIQENNLEKEIIFTGYIPDEDLNLLINRSEFVVYPSLYEGFGLPVLEAMACGKVVITSNVSSLPEVGGEAAIYCDPYNINDMADKMFKLIQNSEIQKFRNSKSIEQAAKFSWKKCAKETNELYKMVLA